MTRSALNFCPWILEKDHDLVYVVVAIEGKICPICKKSMVRKGVPYMNGGHFPSWNDFTLQEQCKKADIQFVSDALYNNHHICQQCADAGKASFICAMCNQERQSFEIQQSFGDPADHLCIPCYRSTPAADWDLKVEELEDLHEYDFE